MELQADDTVVEGWDVYDSEGDRIGAVEEVAPTWLRVEGELGDEIYVPMSSVEAAAGGEVSLDAPASEISTLGWDRPPSRSRVAPLLDDGIDDGFD
jgi:hypothetical protein